MNIKFIKNKNCIKKFFFPIDRLFSSIKILTFIAVIFALYIFLVLCTMNSVLNFSIPWIPIMVLGWYVGPIYSCFLAIIFDNIRFFLLSQVGGLWFWLYAIQAPLVALISGLFGSIFHYRFNYVKTSSRSLIFDVIFSNLIVITFFIFTIFMLISFVNNSTKFSGSGKIGEFFLFLYKWIAICFLIFGLIIFEAITIFNFRYKLRNKDNSISQILVLCYCSSLVLVIMFIFPFVLQPVARIEYCKYCGLSNRSFLFYLIPQTFRQSIIVPIEIFILKTIVLVAQKQFNEINDQINNQWKN